MPLSPEGIGIIFILYLRPFILCIAAVQDHAVICTVYLDTILRIHLTKDIYNFISFIVQFYFCAKNHRCIAGYIKFIIVCSVVRCSQSSLECQYAAIFNDRCRNVIFHFQCSRFRRLVFHCNIAWYYCGFSGYRCCIRKPRCCDHRIFGNWRSRCFCFFQCFDRICQCICDCLNILIFCLVGNSVCCIPGFFECLVRILGIFISRFYFFCICKCCCQSFACLGYFWCFCIFFSDYAKFCCIDKHIGLNTSCLDRFHLNVCNTCICFVKSYGPFNEVLVCTIFCFFHIIPCGFAFCFSCQSPVFTMIGRYINFTFRNSTICNVTASIVMISWHVSQGSYGRCFCKCDGVSVIAGQFSIRISYFCFGIIAPVCMPESFNISIQCIIYCTIFTFSIMFQLFTVSLTCQSFQFCILYFVCRYAENQSQGHNFSFA